MLPRDTLYLLSRDHTISRTDRDATQMIYCTSVTTTKTFIDHNCINAWYLVPLFRLRSRCSSPPALRISPLFLRQLYGCHYAAMWGYWIDNPTRHVFHYSTAGRRISDTRIAVVIAFAQAATWFDRRWLDPIPSVVDSDSNLYHSIHFFVGLLLYRFERITPRAEFRLVSNP